jgi:hypothetical protein
MTPGELSAVWASWAELRPRRVAVASALARRYRAVGLAESAAVRAGWLTEAVDHLVDQLAAPSRLAERAHALAATWPDPPSAPSFATDGRAWLCAARECSTTWSAYTERSWRQAWFLLAEVLAAETLSPFGTAPPC